MYMLDTNVISETAKKKPNPNVLRWLASVDSNKLVLSVLSLGEIRKGVERLTEHAKKQQIMRWLEMDLIAHFAGRIITIDEKVADKWGYLCSHNTLPAVDGLIAASALVHNLKLVTRNTKDFSSILELELINPWEE
jgi:predicted nucleic acid-binding protein